MEGRGHELPLSCTVFPREAQNMKGHCEAQAVLQAFQPIGSYDLAEPMELEVSVAVGEATRSLVANPNKVTSGQNSRVWG